MIPQSNQRAVLNQRAAQLIIFAFCCDYRWPSAIGDRLLDSTA
jgi:hypothetical protein